MPKQELDTSQKTGNRYICDKNLRSGAVNLIKGAEEGVVPLGCKVHSDRACQHGGVDVLMSCVSKTAP